MEGSIPQKCPNVSMWAVQSETQETSSVDGSLLLLKGEGAPAALSACWRRISVLSAGDVLNEGGSALSGQSWRQTCACYEGKGRFELQGSSSVLPAAGSSDVKERGRSEANGGFPGRWGARVLRVAGMQLCVASGWFLDIEGQGCSEA